MNYIEYLEKSNQSMDEYEELKSKRPEKTEDTDCFRKHWIKELRTHLRMLNDIKNVLHCRDLEISDIKYLELIKLREMLIIGDNIEALADPNITLGFEDFLDGVNGNCENLDNLLDELRKMIERSDEPRELKELRKQTKN